MSEENLQATEMEPVAKESATQDESGDKTYSPDEVASLMKALRSEREARKTYERQVREKENQLQRFADVNPD